MKNRKYTFWQRLFAAFSNTNVEWYCATKMERAKMMYETLDHHHQQEFLREIIFSK